MASIRKTAKKWLKNIIGYILFPITTLVPGFLAFTGFLNITSALAWCVFGFIFAVAVEETVNQKSIFSAMLRLETTDYLATKLIRKLLKEKLDLAQASAGGPFRANAFLRLYAEQLKKIQTLEHQVEDENVESHYSVIARRGRWFAGYRKSSKCIDLEKNLTKQRARLRWMERSCVRVLEIGSIVPGYNNSNTPMGDSIRELFPPAEQTSLQKEARWKKNIIRLFGVICLLSGTVIGIALYNNLFEAFNQIGGFDPAVVPSWSIICVVALAGLGAALYLFQAGADFIESVDYTPPHALLHAKDETTRNRRRKLRVVVGLLAIAAALILAATTKNYFINGLSEIFPSLGYTEIISMGALAVLVFATVLFNIGNAFGVVDTYLEGNLFRKQKEEFHEHWEAAEHAWKKHKNWIRCIERAFDWLIEFFTLLFHVGVTGVSMDGTRYNKPATSTIGGFNEYVTDLNYTEGHSHDRGFIAEILFLPITLVLEFFRFLAAGWEYLHRRCFGEYAEFGSIWAKMCTHHHDDDSHEEAEHSEDSIKPQQPLIHHHPHHSHSHKRVIVPLEAPKADTLSAWRAEEARERVWERGQELNDERSLFLQDSAPKQNALRQLFNGIKEEKKEDVEMVTSSLPLSVKITKVSEFNFPSALSTQRFSFCMPKQSETTDLLDELQGDDYAGVVVPSNCFSAVEAN